MQKAAELMDLVIQKLLQNSNCARIVPGVDGGVVADHSLQGVDAVVLLQHAVELRGMSGTRAGVEELMRQIFASQWT